jgi:hypothetical protein
MPIRLKHESSEYLQPPMTTRPASACLHVDGIDGGADHGSMKLSERAWSP